MVKHAVFGSQIDCCIWNLLYNYCARENEEKQKQKPKWEQSI